MLRQFNCFKGVPFKRRVSNADTLKGRKVDSESTQHSDAPRRAIEKGPLVIKTAKHGPSLIREQPPKAQSAKRIITKLSEYGKVDFGTAKLVQSSLDKGIPDGFRAAKHGLVNAVVEAYGTHHHLVIRPDDLWLAIMTQFSFYVNANAEELRKQFVAHEGQTELKIETDGFEDFLLRIVDLIEENVTDPDLREWVLPDFTTTTTNDTVVASVVMMGTLQAYFKYYCCITCGIPSVTLLGDVADYQKILNRLDKLAEFGEQAIEFRNLLVPVMRGFINCFNDPDGEATLRFWNNVAKVNGGSGPDELTGWITAFCHWNSKGEVLLKTQSELRTMYSSMLPQFFGLDGVYYDFIDMVDLPSGFTRVPLTLVIDCAEYECELLAGSVGVNCTESGEKIKCYDGKERIGLDTLQPHVGWFVYEKEGLGVIKD